MNGNSVYVNRNLSIEERKKDKEYRENKKSLANGLKPMTFKQFLNN